MKKTKDPTAYDDGKLGAIRNPDGIWINSSVFKEEANSFLKRGTYCIYPTGSHDWFEYWTEQRRRCMEGYSVGGVKITGEHYCYLNFLQIKKTEDPSNIKSRKIIDFPDFWDGDYNYFWIREIAKEGLLYSFADKATRDRILKLSDIEQIPELKKLYDSLMLQVKIPTHIMVKGIDGNETVKHYLKGGYNIIVGKSRRKGYQLPHSEIVMTPYGKRYMGEMMVGDEVSTPSGGIAKIKEIYPQGLDNVYELQLYDGRRVRCGFEHLWEIYGEVRKKGVRDKRVVETSFLLNEKLVTGSRYRWFLKVNNEIENKALKKLPIPPYTLGCILCSSNIKKQLKISCKDLKIYDNIVADIGSQYSLESLNKYEKQIVYNDGVSNPYYEALKDFKLTNNHVFMSIPDVYKYHSSVEDRYELVKGMMDSCGKSTTKGTITFINISKQLVEDLQEVLYSLGISSVYKKKDDYFHSLCIYSNKNIFKLEKLSKKVNVNRKTKDFIPIVAVRNLKHKEESSCFLLDNDEHLFLTNKYVVTHNSYKSAAVATNNYFTKPDSKTFFGAYDKKFLFRSDAVFTMAKNNINFINEHTAWSMPNDFINRQDHIKASYKEIVNGLELEKGFKSEVQGVTFKDNADALRGKDAEDIFFEESGAFGTPGLLKQSYVATQDCVMDGVIKTGMITIFGCVCAGTKVWDKYGMLRNIEDITKDTGIIGYAGKGVIEENISWLKPPAKKQCVRITTDKGEKIECSTDHPLLWSRKGYKDCTTKNKKATFKEAKDIKVGDYLLQSLQMPKFGDKQMWQPRLVGLLIGDGYYGGEHSCVELSISEKELWDYVTNLGIDYTERKEKHSDKPYFRCLNFKGTQNQMRLLGLQGQSKQLKRLPQNIWEYDKKSVAELLGGYFDADGYICAQGKRKKITLTSVVKELLEEVKIQLYKFGIQSNIYKRHHKKGVVLKSNVTVKTSELIGYSDSYSLEICDIESIRNFKKHIKLLVNKKTKELESFDLSKRYNEEILVYQYEHTIEKGDYFIANPILENLKARKVTSVMFIGEKDIYNLTADHTHTYLTNNFISHNTSGDLEGGTADYADMHSRPEAFDLLPFNNIWDKGLEGTTCGFFHPINWNLPGFYDEQGNSDFEKAKNVELTARQALINNGSTSSELQRRLQEKPLGPMEAFGNVSTNNFPTAELKQQLAKVKANDLQELKGTPVSFSMEGNNVKATPILDGSVEPITSLHNLPTDLRGCPVIYEHPVSNTPRGLYKIGYDPIRQDFGTSLAAIIVYKSFHIGTTNYDCIVAEYIGRYEDPDNIDRLAMMFAIFYNTEIMHENEVTSVKNYFRRIKRLDLLAAQPDLVISKNIKNSSVSRVYGCHMTPQLKDAGERYINSWLLKVVDYDEHGEPITTIDRIYSRRLLEELISYNRRGNFDLISALIVAMFQVQEEEVGKKYGDKKENDKVKQLLSMIKDMYKK